VEEMALVLWPRLLSSWVQRPAVSLSVAAWSTNHPHTESSHEANSEDAMATKRQYRGEEKWLANLQFLDTATAQTTGPDLLTSGVTHTDTTPHTVRPQH